jgi:4-amino-4-deoxy-L-arabinose transferase-like glycosyltransferase
VNNKNLKIIGLLLLIIAIGFFLRFYNIDNAPPGVYPDEAVNGEDAVRSINTGDYQWFYPANNGREGLMMNLIAFCFQLFGISVLTLRLPSIIFGTLTILGTYLLGKELFNTRVGLIGSFLVSVGYWAINFSRISFRANMLPTILVFSFYFLWKGLRTKSWTDFAIGGSIFGIGLHTYIAFRIAPAILVVALISLMLTRQNFLKEYWKKMAVFVLFFLLAASPMLYTFFYAHPEYLESRSASISVFSPELNHGHPFLALGKSFVLSLAKYNFFGDQNWRHNYPPYPLLDLATGIGFLFGVVYITGAMFKTLFERFSKKIRNPQMDKYVFLMAWFFAMLAPEFLTAEGNPHALRSIGTLPVVFLFSAITFDMLLKKTEECKESLKKLCVGLIIFALVFIGIFNSVKYHYFWANSIEAARAFEKPLMDISDYLKTVPPATEKYILTGNMQRVPIRLFNEKMPNITFLYPGQSEDIKPQKPGDFLVILTERNDQVAKALVARFPGLQFEEKRDQLGTGYYILKF